MKYKNTFMVIGIISLIAILIWILTSVQFPINGLSFREVKIRMGRNINQIEKDLFSVEFQGEIYDMEQQVIMTFELLRKFPDKLKLTVFDRKENQTYIDIYNADKAWRNIPFKPIGTYIYWLFSSEGMGGKVIAMEERSGMDKLAGVSAFRASLYIKDIVNKQMNTYIDCFLSNPSLGVMLFFVGDAKTQKSIMAIEPRNYGFINNVAIPVEADISLFDEKDVVYKELKVKINSIKTNVVFDENTFFISTE